MEIGKLNAPVDLAPGDWIEDIPALPGVRLKVRSTNFKPYESGIQGLARRLGKKMNTDDGVAKFSIATGKVLADHILLDWDLSAADEDVKITQDGQPFAYTADNALAVLTANDEHGLGKAYRNGVEWAGDRVAERIRERAKEVSGN